MFPIHCVAFGVINVDEIDGKSWQKKYIYRISETMRESCNFGCALDSRLVGSGKWTWKDIRAVERLQMRITACLDIFP